MKNSSRKTLKYSGESPGQRRRGAVVVLAAFMMVPLFAFLAFSIDVGYIAAEKAKLQAAADASALASIHGLPHQSQVDSIAQQYAALNYSGGSNVTVTAEAGTWDTEARTFTPGSASTANAVRVTIQRNNLSLFFAPIIGQSQTNVSAQAIALRGTGGGTRFLIDDEMIDTDIPVIQQLAATEGKSEDDLISDLDGDWFIDLPPGAVLELPTGQVGDEGLLDIMVNEGTGLPKFPYGTDTTPSHEDFLNYDEDSSSWRYDLIDKDDLDPLPGTGRWNDASRYHELVNPSFVHVSPVYKSDVSALDGVGDPVENGANALGERRGLLAFKIIGVGTDPDGAGSVLPNLIIKIVDPAEVDLNTTGPSDGSSSTARLVQ